MMMTSVGIFLRSNSLNLILLFILLTCPTIDTQESCDSYTFEEELHFLHLRATSHISSSTFTEDNSIGGYYRVADLRMPTSPPAIAACGTYYPIWMDGEFPSILDGLVERTACQVGFFDNCSIQYEIKVRNCDLYAVYKLEATTGTSAYCFDAFGGDGDPPEYIPPAVTVKVKLDWRSQTSSTGLVSVPHMVFSCDFNPSEDASHVNYVYHVAWFVDDTFITENKATKSVLHNTDLHDDKIVEEGYGLGISLECKVRVSAAENGYPNTGKDSDRFFAGVEISNTSLKIYRDESQLITVRPTVPVACIGASAFPTPDTCAIELLMSDPKDYTNKCAGSTVSVSNSQLCRLALTGVNPKDDQSNWEQKTEFSITTKTDGVKYDMDTSTFTLNILTSQLAQGFKIWQSYSPGSITVQVLDKQEWKGRTCHATIDPHMKTATGRLYECQYSGEFIMYRLLDKKQEVQIRTAPCNSVATCVCSASIRAGGDVFHVNLCGTDKIEIFQPCQESILDVKRKGTSYYEDLNDMDVV